MEADLFKALIGLGPGGVVAAYSTWMYWQERKERQEAQARSMKMLEDTIESRHALAAVLEKIVAKVGA